MSRAPAEEPETAILHGNRFRLEGPSARLDPRIHAYRPDVADIGLASSIFASHYARPEIRYCTIASIMVRGTPDEGAAAISQLLHGEGFAVVDISGGWAWGYCLHDHYVGYLPATTLIAGTAPATHVVTTAVALVFSRADIKSPLVDRLAMGAKVTALSMEGDFVETASGWLHMRHLAPVDGLFDDPVSVAMRLVGTPYLWGGRSGDGIDCSGLVQLCLGLCGRDAPRDSDQQREALGQRIDDAALQRGDLVFFPGHVGMMVDDSRIVHANAWWMAVTIEPLADVVARLAGDHQQPVLAVKRL